MRSLRAKPTPSVKFVSLFFVVTGVVLILGLVKALSEIPLIASNINIFLIYIFLSLLCFCISAGLYLHKKWALYSGYAFGLYLIVNFFINMNLSFPVDLAIAGIPIILLIILVLWLLMRKHHHFIH